MLDRPSPNLAWNTSISVLALGGALPIGCQCTSLGPATPEYGSERRFPHSIDMRMTAEGEPERPPADIANLKHGPIHEEKRRPR